MPFLLSGESPNDGPTVPIELEQLLAAFDAYAAQHPDLQWLPMRLVAPAIIELHGKFDPAMLQEGIPIVGKVVGPSQMHMAQLIRVRGYFVGQTIAQGEQPKERLVCVTNDDLTAIERWIRVPADRVQLPMEAEVRIREAELDHGIIEPLRRDAARLRTVAKIQLAWSVVSVISLSALALWVALASSSNITELKNQLDEANKQLKKDAPPKRGEAGNQKNTIRPQ